MNKKSGFLTFCFAFIPGLGHMYHGYMKRGISIMTALILLVTLVATFSTVLFPLMIGVLWAAAFFDTFHLAALTEEQRRARPDDWIWNSLDRENTWNMSHHKALGIGCIVLGLWLCLDQMPAFLSELGFEFGGITWVLRRYIPSVALALALIWFGFRFIAGPRKTDTSATWQPQELPSEEVGEDAPKEFFEDVISEEREEGAE